MHVGHDGAGNRVTATFYEGGALVNESYAYDGNNRLTSINRGGLTTSARSYDAADRVTQTISYSSPGVINERRDTAVITPTASRSTASHSARPGSPRPAAPAALPRLPNLTKIDPRTRGS